MSFREYMRWDGWLGVAVGVALYGFGLVEGHQEPADAVVSGVVMILGTALFMAVRHRVPLRRPGAWFTTTPLALADEDAAPCPRRVVIFHVVAQTAAGSAIVVGLSFVTGFWLTYMDFGVWAIAMGVVKLGPASVAIAEHERACGTTYHVSRRPVRGVVELAGPGRRPAT